MELRSASGQTHRFDSLVIAAGAWSTEVLPDSRLPLTVERQLMVWLRPPSIAEFQTGRFPIFMWEAPTGGSCYGFPSSDSATVKVAQHHGGERTAPDDLRRDWELDEALRVRAQLADVLPGLARAEVARAVACMYTDTPDLHFALGPCPGIPRVNVACGFSGHGFKFSPVIGEVMADLALEGETQRPIEPLSLSRLRGPAATMADPGEPPRPKRPNRG